MPAHHLLYGNMCLDTNKLKIHPIGMEPFENNTFQKGNLQREGQAKTEHKKATIQKIDITCALQET